jgi:hypothetical protein
LMADLIIGITDESVADYLAVVKHFTSVA